MLNLDLPANEQSWFSPPSDITLIGQEVHVWQANLDQPSQIVQELGKTLSEGELARAKRIAFQHDRRRFVVSYGILRKILSTYLHTESTQLEFRHQTWGKPYLSGKFEKSGMRFNISHS